MAQPCAPVNWAAIFMAHWPGIIDMLLVSKRLIKRFTARAPILLIGMHTVYI